MPMVLYQFHKQLNIDKQYHIFLDYEDAIFIQDLHKYVFDWTSIV